jgi:lipoyl(octanoyl) transferase
VSAAADPSHWGVEFDYVGITDDPPRLLDYQVGWDLQRQVHAQVASGELPPRVLYVEHDHVFTAGHRTEPHERPLDGTPVVDVDRGGKITYHGPGQLVGYPIVGLPDRVGVVDYVRRVEEALIRGLAEYGLATGRIPGRTGVWLPANGRRGERKIAAIGVRVAKRTTMHGFALNIDPDLSYFAKIIPCGIDDAEVTSVATELGSAPALVRVAERLEPHLADLLAFRPYQPRADLRPADEALTSPSVTYGLTVAPAEASPNPS